MPTCSKHIIYSAKEKLHAPDQEWNFGRMVPYPEKEIRGETIINELKLRGYDSLLEETSDQDIGYLESVHSTEMINHIRSCQSLPESEAIYPHIFPYHHYGHSESEINYRMAGYFCFDVGTIIGKNTFVAAKAAADTAVQGARCLLENDRDRVFALCRPPGHHADYKHYGGYCYFNNAAAAANLLSTRGKTAILDLDYHHGNGTQGIFYHTPTVYYISIHGDPRENYPYFSGFAAEKGEGLGYGHNLNLPLSGSVGDNEYFQALDQALQKISDYNPYYLIISMGFDTFVKDPLGDFKLSEEAFRRIGTRIEQMKIPTLTCLEGGYDVDDLGDNATNYAETFLELT
ncbi:MAG: histone deacetylase family protein [Candidatus Sumerlaeia bacterium]